MEDQLQDAGTSEHAQRDDALPDAQQTIKFLSELVEQSLAAFGSEGVDKASVYCQVLSTGCPLHGTRQELMSVGFCR